MTKTTAGIATQGLDDIAVAMTAMQRSSNCGQRISEVKLLEVTLVNKMLPISIHKRCMGEDHPGTQYPWKSDSKFGLYRMEKVRNVRLNNKIKIPAGLLSKNCTNVLSTAENIWL